MSATGSDFSAKSDETVLWFALAEFQLLQPLTEGPSPEEKVRLLLYCRQISLLAAGSEAEGTCNLTLGETLPTLSTRIAKINTKWKVPLSCFNVKVINESHQEINSITKQFLFCLSCTGWEHSSWEKILCTSLKIIWHGNTCYRYSIKLTMWKDTNKILIWTWISRFIDVCSHIHVLSMCSYTCPFIGLFDHT